jgi:hypothetical protein
MELWLLAQSKLGETDSSLWLVSNVRVGGISAPNTNSDCAQSGGRGFLVVVDLQRGWKGLRLLMIENR